ncbi:MAG TPA: TonB-dependent receptor [Candidatus Elarobacter sp.]
MIAAPSGSVTFRVIDASTKQPIALARVTLVGPKTVEGFTDETGSVRFADVPDGSYYGRVAVRGYVFRRTAPFDVAGARDVALDVPLQDPKHLVTIGKSGVRTRPAVSDIAAGDGIASRVGGGIADILNGMGDLGTTASSADGAVQGLAIAGFSPDQTGVSVDGVENGGVGASKDARLVDADLYAGVNVNTTGSPQSPAGSLELRTLDPTLRWTATARSGVGSLDRSFTTLSASGTAGIFGISATHSVRGAQAAIAGTGFLDTSGLTYRHDGASSQWGDLVKLRTPLGLNGSATLTASRTAFYQDVLCLRLATAVPCGYGPGNHQQGEREALAFDLQRKVGNVSARMNVYRNREHIVQDERNRIEGGQSVPLLSDSVSNVGGLFATVDAAVSSRVRLGIVHSSSTTKIAVTNSATSFNAFAANRFDSTSAYATMALGSAGSAYVSIVQDRVAGVSGGDVSAGLDLRRGNQSYSVSALMAHGGVAATPRGPFSDIASIRFDCAGDTAFASGPGRYPDSTSTEKLRASWTDRLRNGEFSLTASVASIQGSTLAVPINSAALDLPLGFFQQAQLGAMRYGGCAGALPSPNNLFVTMPIPDLTQRSASLTAGAALSLGDALTLYPSMTLQSSRYSSANPLLRTPGSIVFDGAQALGVPTFRSSLFASYRRPGSPYEALAAASYVGRPNANLLNPYATLSLAVQAHLRAGTFSLAATNVTGTDGGTFASPANGSGLPTLGGGLLALDAVPLPRRQIAFTFSRKIGTGAVPFAVDPRDDGSNDTFTAINISAEAFPSAPPADPFAVTTDRPACTRPRLDRTQRFLRDLRVNIASNGVSSIAGTTTERVSDPDGSSAVHVHFDQQLVREAIFSCAVVHAGGPVTAHRLGLYVPSAAMSFEDLYFSPRAGLYSVFAGGVSPSTTAVTAITDAFALRAGCPSTLAPAARVALAELRLRLGNQPPDLRDTAHWSFKMRPDGVVALHLNDPALAYATSVCSHLHTYSTREARTDSVTGAFSPDLNYAPRLGLYEILP